MAPTIPGGERAITDMHGWNQQNGPGKVFHDLLISSACQVLYGEYQNGNNAGLTAQAVYNIWNHPQLTPLWNRNSEDELKATIRALVAHRRHKFAGGLRRDWPANVPQPPFQWFMQINNGAAGAGQNGALQRQIPVSDMVVIVKRRYGNFFGRMFAIRVVELLPQGEDTVTDFSMLDFNTLIHYLNQDQCFALNAQTETLVWTDEDGHDMPIDRQFAFEAALQMQYNSGVKNMKLEVVNNPINSGNVQLTHSGTQPHPTNYPTPEESYGQHMVTPNPQTMTPAPAHQNDGNYGTSDERMHVDHTFSNAHPLSGTQELNYDISSAEQQTAGPFGAGPSVNSE